MCQVELLVSLKIPDVTALTAANTLRRRMGFEGVLDRIERADYFLFEVQASTPDEACAVVRNIAEHTNLFVNPNKHVFQVRPRQERAGLARTDGLFVANCLVRSLEYDPGPGLVASLQGLGHERVRGIQTGTLWTLHLRVEDEARARSIAESIALTTSRSQGLLMNPHYQTCEVY